MWPIYYLYCSKWVISRRESIVYVITKEGISDMRIKCIAQKYITKFWSEQRAHPRTCCYALINECKTFFWKLGPISRNFSRIISYQKWHKCTQYHIRTHLHLSLWCEDSSQRAHSGTGSCNVDRFDHLQPLFQQTYYISWVLEPWNYTA